MGNREGGAQPRPEPKYPDPSWVHQRDPWEVAIERILAGFMALLGLLVVVVVTSAWVWSIPAFIAFVGVCWLIGRAVIHD